MVVWRRNFPKHSNGAIYPLKVTNTAMSTPSPSTEDQMKTIYKRVKSQSDGPLIVATMKNQEQGETVYLKIFGPVLLLGTLGKESTENFCPFRYVYIPSYTISSFDIKTPDPRPYGVSLRFRPATHGTPMDNRTVTLQFTETNQRDDFNKKFCDASDPNKVFHDEQCDDTKPYSFTGLEKNELSFDQGHMKAFRLAETKVTVLDVNLSRDIEIDGSLQEKSQIEIFDGARLLKKFKFKPSETSEPLDHVTEFMILFAFRKNGTRNQASRQISIKVADGQKGQEQSTAKEAKASQDKQKQGPKEEQSADSTSGTNTDQRKDSTPLLDLLRAGIYPARNTEELQEVLPQTSGELKRTVAETSEEAPPETPEETESEKPKETESEKPKEKESVKPKEKESEKPKEEERAKREEVEEQSEEQESVAPAKTEREEQPESKGDSGSSEATDEGQKMLGSAKVRLDRNTDPLTSHLAYRVVYQRRKRQNQAATQPAENGKSGTPDM